MMRPIVPSVAECKAAAAQRLLGLRPAALTLSLLTGFLVPAERLPAQDAGIPSDNRVPVEMPALQQALLQREMVAHTATLHQLLGHLAEGQLEAAAELAEGELGLSSMGKHAAATRGMGPGRFMPDAMRAMGIGMHEAASRFAEVAREGDVAAAYRALQPVTAACVSCHATYRLEAAADSAGP